MRVRQVVNLLIFCANLLLLAFQLSWIPWSGRHDRVTTLKSVQPTCPPPEKAVVLGTGNQQPVLSVSGQPFITWNHNWDGREEPEDVLERKNQGVPEKRKKKRGTRRLFMIRHGQYYGTGPRSGHLSPIGKQQAHMVGKRLKEMNLTFDVFIASAAVRAGETADIIHEYIPYLDIIREPLLKEGWPTYPEPPVVFWDPNHVQFGLDGARIDAGYRKWIHRADYNQTKELSHELIVAHGNVIGNFLLRALQLPPERWLKLAVYQCSISIIDIPPDGQVTVRSAGDVGHLPSNLWTG